MWDRKIWKKNWFWLKYQRAVILSFDHDFQFKNYGTEFCVFFFLQMTSECTCIIIFMWLNKYMQKNDKYHLFCGFNTCQQFFFLQWFIVTYRMKLISVWEINSNANSILSTLKMYQIPFYPRKYADYFTINLTIVWFDATKVNLQ